MIKKEKTVDLFHFSELTYDAQRIAVRRIMDSYCIKYNVIDDIEKQGQLIRNLLSLVVDKQILFYKDWKSFHTEGKLLSDICKKIFW